MILLKVTGSLFSSFTGTMYPYLANLSEDLFGKKKYSFIQAMGEVKLLC